jgi:methylthioxylose transferase
MIILGINRGEITRLWIYLAVFFQVPTAYFLAKIDYSKGIFYLVACTLVIQCFITLPRVAFVVP